VNWAGSIDNISGRNRTLSSTHRSTHTYVIGQPGTGKSRALESWIMQDILAGRGVGVIDPHGDLFNNILTRLTNYPQVWNRVVIVDPLDPDWVVSINPLERIQGIPPQRTASLMTDVMIKIWQLDISNAPRMLWLVTNTFLALTLSRRPLSDILLFLGDPSYRVETLSQVNDENVLRYFEVEFPKNPGAIQQWIAPALNKLGALLFDPDVKPMLSGVKPLDFRKIMDQRMVLLVNIPKGTLGESTSALLGAFILARIQSSALSRASTQKRPSFYLYMDEFQNYTTENVKDILAESRKYSLSITFAHQYLDQLQKSIHQAVLNTAGIIIVFRVGYQDARRLSHEIFPSSVSDQVQKPKLVYKTSRYLPTLKIEFQKEDIKYSSHLLTDLKHREFWVKIRSQKSASKNRSFEMKDVPITRKNKKIIQELRKQAGSTFGYQKIIKNKNHPSRSNEQIPLWD